MSKEQMEEEKDEILSNFKKTKRPEVPSDYFDSFQKKMLEKVQPEEKKKKTTPPKEKDGTDPEGPAPIQFNMRYLYYTVGVAAAVVLIFLAVNNLDFGSKEQEPAPVVEESTEEKVDTLTPYIDYIEEHITDFSTEELIDVLAENEDFSVEEKVDLSEVPSSEVENYILDEYEDFEDELIDEL